MMDDLDSCHMSLAPPCARITRHVKRLITKDGLAVGSRKQIRRCRVCTKAGGLWGPDVHPEQFSGIEKW